MWDISSEELAKRFTVHCSEYKNAATRKKNSCISMLKKINSLKESLNNIVSSMESANGIAGEAAGYFDQGAYKDGIINYAEKIETMITNAESSVENIKTVISEIDTYIKNISDYLKDIRKVERKWILAANYYSEHKTEILVK